MRVDETWIRDVLVDLVGCDSVNPAFAGADGRLGRGEGAIALLAAERLSGIGLEVALHEAAPGRPSVVGRLRGSGGGKTLMLNGHLDTVGPGGMERPFEPRLEGSRLYGRGAYDMKGGVAAAMGAAEAVARSGRRLRGDLLVALVADEEERSLGTYDVAGRHPVDGAVVTEPTEGRLCVAHKGFTWVRLATEGFACHGSDVERGVDANLRMGRVLAELAELVADLGSRRPHPLLGPPSLHVALLSGGAGPSIYSPSCSAQLERRTLPGEEGVVEEVRRFVEERAAGIGAGAVTVEEVLARQPFEARADSPLAGLLGEALAAHSPGGSAATPGGSAATGVPFWTDAAILRARGADVVLLGPAGAGAHQDVEWVDLGSVATCAQVLADVAVRYCG